MALLKFLGIRGKKHPSEKPVDLFEHLILNSSNNGDVVLDPFMGSGTLAEACVKNNNGRKYIGYELDENYYEMARDRTNQNSSFAETINK